MSRRKLVSSGVVTILRSDGGIISGERLSRELGSLPNRNLEAGCGIAEKGVSD
jgi:hypothetical protein